MSSTVVIERPLFLNSSGRGRLTPRFLSKSGKIPHSSLKCSRRRRSFPTVTASFSSFTGNKPPPRPLNLRSTTADTAVVQSEDVIFSHTFPLKRRERVEGKITIRLDGVKDDEDWKLTVGCNLPGKWVLHWGVNYLGDVGSEWDQPPPEMRPSGSVSIKDYAVETPLALLSTVSEGEALYEVKMDINNSASIAAINFVLKDEETGAWYQHRGRDFKAPLFEYLQDDGNTVGSKRGLSIWPGPLGQLSNILIRTEKTHPEDDKCYNDPKEQGMQKMRLEGFYEEHTIAKETIANNWVSVVARQCSHTAQKLVHIETDLPGNVLIHWGVCKDVGKQWELPAEPYPAGAVVFKNKALQTLLQRKEDGNGSWGSVTLSEGFLGFVFVLKLESNAWLRYEGNDFYVPLSNSSGQQNQPSIIPSVVGGYSEESRPQDTTEGSKPVSSYTDEIISEIRNLVSGISSEKSQVTKSRGAQEIILHEIEKLAAEAYRIFRRSSPTFSETDEEEADSEKPHVKISSGTGSGYEIVCQGFNWESHKSGRWYMELHEKATDLAALGFTVIWLPPPTDSVSPEGYMPTDLYNLNSRYGNIDELKILVGRLHDVGSKVLGDAVLNHRCAQYKNPNGIWNIYGGRLNWDDRAVVADDPHFQGRGNKSSGDNFHAAPNIDHSQEFVRKDLKEWLCWLRKEVGYDGWRLDFVRGFWGGYVKDYIDASEPYFSVGEYWDSLSYTYGEMDPNQDAHRQRIIDWINATNGTAGAFDVTTKGILHSALERCEYWRLSDDKGKPPGVVGWWPSRAVTFIENHDTGSTQGHWRFPSGKEMLGYAYILTHPGTPSVFYDHIFSDYRSEIASLISIRKQNKIHCRSTVQITKAERDVYAAVIDEKLAMKIGPGHYEPPSEQSWKMATEGKDYKIWEANVTD